ncbi:MAG: NAD(P)-dependent oxidoreductase, partial [Tepidisphaeraceae bacterium]
MIPTPLAFIGLGIMGLPMAGHLLRAGNDVTVYSRTKSKAEPLLRAGAKWADTPAAAASKAVTTFICVTDTPDVEAVLFGEQGVAAGALLNSIIVDHSTISPSATQAFAKRLAERKLALIDAPVSGGDTGAKNATLSIMCGGERQAFDRVRPLLETMGKTITYCGPSGAGQLTKLVNQVLVLGTLNAVCEAMTLVKSGGLDPATVLAAVGAGAAKSWQLENLAPKIAAGDFEPGFMVDLAQKDLRLVLEQADAAQLALPGTAWVHQLFNTVQKLG